MEGPTSTSVTIEDCVEAMSGLNIRPQRAGLQPTPFILNYKSKRYVKSDTASQNTPKHPGRRERSRTPQSANLERSQSTLGVRLKYQDFLLRDYVNYKRDLISGKRAQIRENNGGKRRSTTPINRRPNPGPTMSPMYQNFFENEFSNFETKLDGTLSFRTDARIKTGVPECVKQKGLKSDSKSRCLSASTRRSEAVTYITDVQRGSRSLSQASMQSRANKPRGACIFKYTKK